MRSLHVRYVLCLALDAAKRSPFGGRLQGEVRGDLHAETPGLSQRPMFIFVNPISMCAAFPAPKPPQPVDPPCSAQLSLLVFCCLVSDHILEFSSRTALLPKRRCQLSLLLGL